MRAKKKKIILFYWLIKILTVPLSLSLSFTLISSLLDRASPDWSKYCWFRGFHCLPSPARPLSTLPLPFSSWVSWVSSFIPAGPTIVNVAAAFLIVGFMGFIVDPSFGFHRWSHRCLPHHGFRGFFRWFKLFFFSCWWWWLFVAVAEEKDWRFEFFFPYCGLVVVVVVAVVDGRGGCG